MSTLRAEEKTFRLVLAASLFLILIGSRAALIGFAGSPAPYMDEWDGDWDQVIRPYLDGTLRLDALTAPFMEHRILFTRLLVLALFHLAGHWDVVLQMIVNAILGSAVLILAAFALSRVLSGGWALAAVLAIALANVAPIAYDNVLLGFNTHFYLLPALSLLALWLMASSPAWSARWTAGALVGAASLFSLASGALTLAAVALTHLLQMACRRRTGASEALGVAALFVATGLILGFVPHVPASDAFRARSFGEFASAVRILVEWPAGGVLGWLLPLPSALFCLKTLADRPGVKDARWFNVAALVWVCAEIAALAAGRGQAVPQSRYFDTLLLGLAIHLVSALWIAETKTLGRTRRSAATFALAAWVAFAGVSLLRAERHLPREIEAFRERVESGGGIVRLYLETGEADLLSGRPGVNLPYIDGGRLRAYLSAPEARAGLPPELLSNDTPPTRVEALKQAFLALAPAWIGLGAGMILSALIWRRLPQEWPRAASPAIQGSRRAPA